MTFMRDPRNVMLCVEQAGMHANTLQKRVPFRPSLLAWKRYCTLQTFDIPCI